ncbi:MAG TPA: glycosyl hydrolase family 18 protein [Pseudonocardiaceae bacterium]
MSRLTSRVAAAATIALLAVATATGTANASPHLSGNQHVVAYYQTQYSNGTYVSPLPLQGIATDVEVAAIHLDDDGSLHINDNPPTDSMFNQMWTDLSSLQNSGVRVEAMLGGAGGDSFANLANNFTQYYATLKNFLSTYHFNGIDLDIEESYSLADTEQLITQLRSDFGSNFEILMAPVASDLSGGSQFSGGFSYSQLESDVGSDINWYNAQFYCGWGDLSSTSSYDAVIANGFPASQVVAGTVTNPANCSGYVDPGTLASTLSSLAGEYSDFAGVAGWEYFNAEPVNNGGPQSWYAAAGNAL